MYREKSLKNLKLKIFIFHSLKLLYISGHNCRTPWALLLPTHNKNITNSVFANIKIRLTTPSLDRPIHDNTMHSPGLIPLFALTTHFRFEESLIKLGES